MQVLPTAPSPTVTHLMNREALIGGADVDLLFSSLTLVCVCERERERGREREGERPQATRLPGADGGRAGRPAGRWVLRELLSSPAITVSPHRLTPVPPQAAESLARLVSVSLPLMVVRVR